jgi:hypothetical protein
LDTLFPYPYGEDPADKISAHVDAFVYFLGVGNPQKYNKENKKSPTFLRFGGEGWL